MAVICVEYPDVKHNEKATVKDWENAFFSRGTYNTVNAVGQPVFGSMNDYYEEQRQTQEPDKPTKRTAPQGKRRTSSGGAAGDGSI